MTSSIGSLLWAICAECAGHNGTMPEVGLKVQSRNVTIALRCNISTSTPYPPLVSLLSPPYSLIRPIPPSVPDPPRFSSPSTPSLPYLPYHHIYYTKTGLG